MLPSRIGLVNLAHSGVDAGVLRGIHRYVRRDRRWRLLEARDNDYTFEALLAVAPMGIIGHINDADTAHRLSERGLPTINLSGIMPDSPFPLVRPDDESIGRMGARHFVDRGYQRIGFFGADEAFHQQREAGLLDEARRLDIKASSYRHDVGGPAPQNRNMQVIARSKRTRWLEELGRPVGILAATDRLAIEFINTCLDLGVDVPGEVAVLGVDNDALICETAYPSLSSITLQDEAIGYEAAAMLDRMLQGEVRADQQRLLAPIGVAERESTNTIAIQTPLVAEALKLIRQRAVHGINVNELVDSLGVNRRTFERRFRSELGRSPLQEIQRVRTEHAERLLATTELSMPEIADAAGFRDAEHLWDVFRRQHNESPTTYRKRFRIEEIGPMPAKPHSDAAGSLREADD